MIKNRKINRLIGSLLFLLCFAFPAKSAHKPLSDSAQVSILISAPFDGDVFSAFGHAALRVNDPGLGVDYVFNHGIFNESGVANVLRFIQGNFSAEFYAISSKEFVEDSKQKDRQLTELMLNFLPEEKESLWQLILEKAEQPKQTYHYDILKENCTALPLDFVEKSTIGTILYRERDIQQSYLSLFDSYLQSFPWVQFFVDLSSGTEVNRPITYRQAFFIPDLFAEALLSARIKGNEGGLRPLVSGSSIIVQGTESVVSRSFTPFLCSLIVLFVILLITIVEWRKKTYLRWFDVSLLGLTGFAGIYLFYFSIIVQQWYSFPNWWLLWIHPLHLLGAVFCVSKRFRKQAYYYHIFNLCALGGAIIGTCFASQHYHPAFVPLIVGFAIRSASYVWRWHSNQKELQ